MSGFSSWKTVRRKLRLQVAVQRNLIPSWFSLYVGKAALLSNFYRFFSPGLHLFYRIWLFMISFLLLLFLAQGLFTGFLFDVFPALDHPRATTFKSCCSRIGNSYKVVVLVDCMANPVVQCFCFCFPI